MTNEREIEPSTEDLDVSLTQAPLLFFIPFPMAIILMISTFALGTFFHTWKSIFTSAALWPLAAVWTRRDRNAVKVFLAKPNLIRLWITAHLYGGYSISPASLSSTMGDDDAA
jgi:type IV secretory pathway VirB3-like protein